jgi:ABC-type phosphate/phosphonate transport system substrate-binding protein
MYDWPETGHALDVLWSHIHNQLERREVHSPAQLERNMHPAAIWSEPELVIGQTCGWPYANYLKEQVVPFARFHYDLPDCPPGHYNSVYIGHDDDDFDHLASSAAFEFIEKIAINSDDSQSGFHVFSEITGEPAEESIAKEKRIITGAHRNSISAIANGDANIAAIDAVAFELAKQYEPEAVSRVVVLGNSRPVPGLPLITSKANQELVPYLYEALQDALDDTPQDILQTLFILGAVKAEPSDYDDFKVEEPL